MHNVSCKTPFNKPHSNQLRKGRFSVKFGIYLATFVTKKRKPLFSDLYLARKVIRNLNKSHYADTLAFVVMPDHVHWLLQLRTSKTLSQVIQAAKITCTKSINKEIDGKGTIWQPGFHDHALRSEEALKPIARYVVANPIRANLVRSVKDYPHWDAVWINNEDVVISSEIKVVPEKPPNMRVN